LIQIPATLTLVKTILLSQNQHIFTFLHPILMCSILSTACDVGFELDLNATHRNTNNVTCRDTKMGFGRFLSDPHPYSFTQTPLLADLKTLSAQ
jgi:hypothetical protein